MYTHLVLWKLKEKALDLNKTQLAVEVKAKLEKILTLMRN